MTSRTAQCSCGQLRATCEGEAALIAICNCDACRRRTGSAFGVSAFYPEAMVRPEGESKTYARVAGSGKRVVAHFCPNCGTSVYWKAELRPELTAVAAGCFADPDYPMPRQSVFDEKRHSWIEFPEEMATRTG